MIFDQLSVGSMSNFCYLVGDDESHEGFIVDPAFDGEKIVGRAKALKLDITRIILTHHHFDHVNAAKAVKARTGASIMAHPGCEEFLRGEVRLDGTLSDGQGFSCGKDCLVKVFHTPGHAPGGICLLVSDKWLITGDTLFVGNCGRTDLEGGDARELFASLGRLKRLPDGLIVCPGHDYGRSPTATLGEEKRLNPALAAGTFEEFLKVP